MTTTMQVRHEEKVHWRPWSDAAFEDARREGKLLLVDIGAVWCHWCHVMDHTTYDDDGVAELVNTEFIPVRVDRDARPDLDRRYQSAPTLVESHGSGWPLTVFLLPDGTPLYRATYVPPQDVGGHMGMLSLAREMRDIWRERRGELSRAAGEVHRRLATLRGPNLHGELTEARLDGLFRSLSQAFDEAWGGFYGAPHNPKFPSAGALEFLLAHAHRTGRDRPLAMVATTLRKMAEGGVYDQIGGGFHRYAVDQYWRVPHFEKLLYDNAELLTLYLHAYQATGRAEFRDVAEGIIRFVDEVLTDREHGGFFGSQDADIGAGDDGDYFTWTLKEAQRHLEGDAYRVFVAYYGVEERGEMHHDPARNVLYRATTVERVAQQLGLPLEEVTRLLDEARRAALTARLKRPTPAVDRRLYTAWNGMMIRAYVLAARALGREDVMASAELAADRLLEQAYRSDGSWRHVAGRDEPAGLLADQAWMALALGELYAATGEARYLDAARATVAWADEHLWDAEGGGYFDEPAGAALTGVAGLRDKPVDDAPSSSPNATMALALETLAALTDDPAYESRAGELLAAFAGAPERLGIYGGALAMAAEVHLAGPTRVVVIGNEEAESPLVGAAYEIYVPGKVVVELDPANGEHVERIEQLGYPVGEPGAIAYVCRGTTCYAPVRTAEELRRTLSEGRQ